VTNHEQQKCSSAHCIPQLKNLNVNTNGNRISLSPISANKMMYNSTSILSDIDTTGMIVSYGGTATGAGTGGGVHSCTTSFLTNLNDDAGNIYLSLKTPPPYTKGNLEFPKYFTPKSYKTPKTLRKNRHVVINTPQSGGHIFGTPDYLSPELLLGKKHDESVDWWALGICLYEFLVGITPFSASSPQEIFDNILKHEIEWPENDEALSVNAVNCIESLLDTQSDKRLRLNDLKSHSLFNGTNWNNLINEQPPFVPMPDHSMDTFYFETRNTMRDNN
jgi:serine/threonine protein kinase